MKRFINVRRLGAIIMTLTALSIPTIPAEAKMANREDKEERGAVDCRLKELGVTSLQVEFSPREPYLRRTKQLGAFKGVEADLLNTLGQVCEISVSYRELDPTATSGASRATRDRNGLTVLAGGLSREEISRDNYTSVPVFSSGLAVVKRETFSVWLSLKALATYDYILVSWLLVLIVAVVLMTLQMYGVDRLPLLFTGYRRLMWWLDMGEPDIPGDWGQLTPIERRAWDIVESFHAAVQAMTTQGFGDKAPRHLLTSLLGVQNWAVGTILAAILGGVFTVVFLTAQSDRSISSIDLHGKTVVALDPSSVPLLKELGAQKVLEENDVEKALALLESNEAYAVIGDDLLLRRTTAERAGLAVADGTLTTEMVSIAIPRSLPEEVREELDSVLTEIRASNEFSMHVQGYLQGE